MKSIDIWINWRKRKKSAINLSGEYVWFIKIVVKMVSECHMIITPAMGQREESFSSNFAYYSEPLIFHIKDGTTMFTHVVPVCQQIIKKWRKIILRERRSIHFLSSTMETSYMGHICLEDTSGWRMLCLENALVGGRLSLVGGHLSLEDTSGWRTPQFGGTVVWRKPQFGWHLWLEDTSVWRTPQIGGHLSLEEPMVGSPLC
jgi:hypothetical protein